MSPGPSSAGPSEADGLDDLRRRLYGPDASPEDVARYRAASGATEDPLTPTPDPPRRRNPRPVVIAALLGVALAITVGVVAARRPADVPTAAPSATPSSTAPASTASSIDLVSAPASVRAGFVRALESGGKAGLLQYFFEHHDRLPPAILTVERADSTEYAGTGTRTIALSPSALAERGGRATVILVVSRSGNYAWQATRAPVREDHSGSPDIVVTTGGGIEAGAPIAGTFGYDRGAPSQLSVRVAAGVRWGAVVVFTN